MNLNEVTGTFDPSFAKYLKKAEGAVRSELKSYFKHKPSPKLEVTFEKPFEARVTLDFQQWLHPGDIDAVDEDFADALKKADVNGHIHKLEVGNAHGSHFVAPRRRHARCLPAELLAGLRARRR